MIIFITVTEQIFALINYQPITSAIAMLIMFKYNTTIHERI